MPRPSPLANRAKVARHREKLRAAGLRPAQLWIWNTGAPGFADTVQGQCASIAAGAEEASVMAWLEQVQAPLGEDDIPGDDP
jgi:hypothetical protein